MRTCGAILPERQWRHPALFDVRGVTLVELMAALVILGLVVAIIPPMLDGVSAKWQLRAAGQDIESTVRQALNTAASTGALAEVIYDLDNQTFRIRSKGDTVDVENLPEGIQFERVRFVDFDLLQDAAALRAFPDGSIDAHTVVLRGSDDMLLKITFDRLTTEARFEEGADASE